MIQNVIKKVSERNSVERVMLKVIEENTELNEVLVKFLTKEEHLKPPLEKIIEESGDVLARISVLNEKLGIQNEVENRIYQKFEQLDKYYI